MRKMSQNKMCALCIVSCILSCFGNSTVNSACLPACQLACYCYCHFLVYKTIFFALLHTENERSKIKNTGEGNEEEKDEKESKQNFFYSTFFHFFSLSSSLSFIQISIFLQYFFCERSEIFLNTFLRLFRSTTTINCGHDES
jgi:hypothetical protein